MGRGHTAWVPGLTPSAAVGELGLVPSPLWVPGSRGPGGHWVVGMQSAWRGAEGTVSQALMSPRGPGFGAQGCSSQMPEPDWRVFRFWP